MAMSGIGASDIVTATLGGAAYGLGLLWALALGAFFKFVLSEGLARWQLATGQSALEGWFRHFPRWIMLLFAAYLVLWSVAVSGALVSACGLAIENITDGAVPGKWAAMVQAALALALIWTAHTGRLEGVMKLLVVLMFAGIVACAGFTIRNPLAALNGLLIPRIPPGSGPMLLSLMGGIGGSLTLLSHNYLLREEENRGRSTLRSVRLDLGMAYLFTGIFGLSVMLIANRVFYIPGIVVTDRMVVSRMGRALAELIGPAGFYFYSVGFSAAVFASLVGVWRTIPAIFADCHGLLRRDSEDQRKLATRSQATPYRVALLFMAFSSIPFGFLGRPLAIVIAFTILGSVFIPFLAGSLLYLNNRVTFPSSIPRNHVLTNLVLWLVIVLYLLVGMVEIRALFKA